MDVSFALNQAEARPSQPVSIFLHSTMPFARINIASYFKITLASAAITPETVSINFCE